MGPANVVDPALVVDDLDGPEEPDLHPPTPTGQTWRSDRPARGPATPNEAGSAERRDASVNVAAVAASHSRALEAKCAPYGVSAKCSPTSRETMSSVVRGR